MSKRHDYYLRQLVTESDVDEGFDYSEEADWDLINALSLSGVASGLSITERSVPDLNVNVSAGVGFDKDGKRLFQEVAAIIDCSVDENSLSTDVVGAGNSKIISIYASFDRTLSDPQTDGNSQTVYFQEDEKITYIVRQGVEGVSPSPPVLDTSMILLADVTRAYGVSTIQTADIDLTNRREDMFVETGTTFALRVGTIKAVIDAVYSNMNSDRAGEPARIATELAAGPTITNATINGASTAISGGGTVTGMTISGGTNDGATFTNVDINSGAIGDGTISSTKVTGLTNENAKITGVPTFTCTEIDSSGDTYLRKRAYQLNGSTTDASTVQAYTWSLKNNAVTTVRVTVQVIDSTSAKSADFMVKRRFRNTAATVTAGTEKPLDDDIETSLNGIECHITNATTTGQIDIKGIASNNLRWTIELEIFETTYAAA